ncbi:MAG: PRC-barrel domain-containing protein [Dokdonella sp.]
MLRDFNDLYGFTLAGSDGPIGVVKDCYFDDQTWTIRFFMVETGAWLGGRKVLISPAAIHALDWAGKALSASISQAKAKASPDIDTSMPVSRQHEVEQLGYYGHPIYWGEGQLSGGGARPGISLAGYPNVGLPAEPQAKKAFVDAMAKMHRDRGDDPHLRSCRAIERYYFHATDGDIGHLESLLVDDDAWVIRYLVVNTSDWWLGHRTLVAPPWITDISWLESTVSVDLARQSIKDAPAYDSKALPSPEQERDLFDHYGRIDHANRASLAPIA